MSTTTKSRTKTLPDPVEKLVIEVEGLKPDENLFDGINLSSAPVFTSGEVAAVFFGKSTSWLRWRDRYGFCLPEDGVPVEPIRNAHDVRQYSLADIEKIAHALHFREAINTHRLVCTLQVLRWVAKGAGVIE